MGLVALHSVHYSKIMKLLMGTSMTLKWKHDESEYLWCIHPAHPIAYGVPEGSFESVSISEGCRRISCISGYRY